MTDDRTAIEEHCHDHLEVECVRLRSGREFYPYDVREKMYAVKDNGVIVQVHHINAGRTHIIRTFPYHGIEEILWSWK